MKKIVAIHLDRERHLRFNLNSLILVEEITGKKMADLNQEQGISLKFLRALLYAGLKWEDKELTLEEVGDLIDMDNMEEVNKKLEEAMKGLK